MLWRKKDADLRCNFKIVSKTQKWNFSLATISLILTFECIFNMTNKIFLAFFCKVQTVPVLTLHFAYFYFAKWFHLIQLYILPIFWYRQVLISPIDYIAKLPKGEKLLARCRILAKSKLGRIYIIGEIESSHLFELTDK